MKIRSPYGMLVGVITRKPWVVLSVLLGIIIVALVGTTFITMATGTDTYLNKDTERGMLLDKYTSTFQSDSLILLVESDDVLSPDVIEYIYRLQNEVADQRM